MFDGQVAVFDGQAALFDVQVAVFDGQAALFDVQVAVFETSGLFTYTKKNRSVHKHAPVFYIFTDISSYNPGRCNPSTTRPSCRTDATFRRASAPVFLL